MTTYKSNGVFFREYWIQHEPKISNQPENGNRWRVNDEHMSVDEKFGDRWETQANGLMLAHIPENPRKLLKAELYLELWGGHPHTGAKHFSLNGKGCYDIPSEQTIEGHCSYTYPTIELDKQHLVNGMNAIQFSCERGTSFWGHYIIDQAVIRCYYEENDPRLEDFKSDSFIPQIILTKHDLGYEFSIEGIDKCLEDISQIDYLGHYFDFDDRGTTQELAWHGFTQKRIWKNHLGTITQKPFDILWNTEMIPDQNDPVMIQATIHFHNGIKCTINNQLQLELPSQPDSAQLIKCENLPKPFWSRDNQLKETTFQIEQHTANIEKASLLVKIWDGGEGDIEKPFTINGHAYSITSGTANHDVVFTHTEIDLEHLRQGTNTIKLLSDTHHHGIEILFPGPCIKIRLKNDNR